MLILHFKCLSVANTKVGTKNFVYHTSRNYFASIRTCNTRLRLVEQPVLMLANVQFLAL
jgi:hypothetical protein